MFIKALGTTKPHPSHYYFLDAPLPTTVPPLKKTVVKQHPGTPENSGYTSNIYNK